MPGWLWITTSSVGLRLRLAFAMPKAFVTIAVSKR